jgi:chlorite dismutase
MIGQRAALLVVLLLITALWGQTGYAAADREQLLAEPGVYGTFAAYRFNEDWAKREGATRIALLSVLKGVVEEHRERIAIDLYLLRGLSDHADILFRAHATELRDIQRFLLDLQSSAWVSGGAQSRP